VSAPLRFIGVAVLAYIGLRTASSALALEPVVAVPLSAAKPPALAQAADAPPMTAAEAPQPFMPYGYAAAGAYAMPAGIAYAPQPGGMMPYPVMMMPAAAMAQPRQSQVIYYPMPYRMPELPTTQVAAASAPALAPVEALPTGYESAAPPIEQWPAFGVAGAQYIGAPPKPGWGPAKGDSALALARPQRWSADAWALVRPPENGVYSLTDPGRGLNPGLASAGSLGGSQAGLRITWKPLRQVGVHLRASTALMPQGRGGQTMAGGEGALGVSWQPLRQLPVRFLAERRQRLGSALGGGRNAFAFLAEGGLYDQALPFGLRLDGYGQAGVVGLSSRDLFADGALAATYPVLPRLSFGGGLWGGIQPGLSRFDAGPRVSYQLSPRLRAQVDYRFRVTGNARPGSGPALNLSAGF